MAGKIARRKDTTPDAGEAKYGDVEYADPTNKKYPIDTEEHVRAALSYINHPTNAAKYSGGDAAKIRAKIHAAAARHGITVAKSLEEGGLMAKNGKSARERLLAAIETDDEETLEKAMPPRRRMADQEDGEDGGAPSQEDREKAAAPKAPVGKGGGGDQDNQDDEDDDQQDDQGDGRQQGDDQQQDDEGDDQQQDDESDDRRAPPPPMPKRQMKKSLEAAADAEVLAEIRRRAEDAPDFLKSLLEGPDAERILEAVDLSEPVAKIVQSASETIAAKDIQIAALTKSLATLTETYGELRDLAELITHGVAKSLEQGALLAKSLGAVSADVVLIKSADSGLVSHGQGVMLPPATPKAKDDQMLKSGTDDDELPDDDPDFLPKALTTRKLGNGLMKSVELSKLTHREASDKMGRLGNRKKDQKVWKELPEGIREIILQG